MANSEASSKSSSSENHPENGQSTTLSRAVTPAQLAHMKNVIRSFKKPYQFQWSYELTDWNRWFLDRVLEPVGLMDIGLKLERKAYESVEEFTADLEHVIEEVAELSGTEYFPCNTVRQLQETIDKAISHMPDESSLPAVSQAVDVNPIRHSNAINGQLSVKVATSAKEGQPEMELDDNRKTSKRKAGELANAEGETESMSPKKRKSEIHTDPDTMTTAPPRSDSNTDRPATKQKELNEFADTLAAGRALSFQDFSAKIQDLAKAYKHMRAMGEKMRSVLDQCEGLGGTEEKAEERAHSPA